MGWNLCSGNSNPKKKIVEVQDNIVDPIRATPEKLKRNYSMNSKDSYKSGSTDHISAQTFSFRELADAARNFKAECLIGKGGFGRVYKGHLESINQMRLYHCDLVSQHNCIVMWLQWSLAHRNCDIAATSRDVVVAIKRLDLNGLQGNREFLVEVLMLSLLHHTNLVNMIGYCADGDQRLLVYEYMSLGSLEDHLHDIAPGKKRLDWNTRMKIAAGAAQGLEYLHDKANPPVIYRDIKCSNILLGEGYHPKLSDFGLAKLGPVGEKTHVSTRVMGSYGYCAPEYAMTGQLTLKSDVYSFGVVLLEIITGRKAIDNSKSAREQNLVAWARPLLKERRNFSQMADPMLQGQYPARGLYQALAVAAMCVQEQANMRPLIADVAKAFSYLATQRYDTDTQIVQSSRLAPGTPPRTKKG
ncbi:hypothetical protein Lal_00012906 [Lupinus albus]|nr:hypothetical protein Lal_00012906 [Lupinus albus]